MKSITTTLFLLFLISRIYGDTLDGPVDLSFKFYDNLTVKGAAKLKLVKASSLDIQGPLEFSRLAISGDAKVAGAVHGVKGTFGKLTVNGPVSTDQVICGDLWVKGAVTVTSLIVNNQAEIEGPLNARHSKFKTLIIKADTIVLDEVEVETLSILKGSQKQVVTLKGHTVISGDVTFESGEGTLEVDKEALIKGTVKGATTKNL